MVKISRPTSNNDSATKKKKNKKKINPNAIAMKVKAPVAKPNPFETIWSRRKFDILGKKRKGEERRIGLARSIAIEKAIFSPSLKTHKHVADVLLFPFINDPFLKLSCSYRVEIWKILEHSTFRNQKWILIWDTIFESAEKENIAEGLRAGW